MDRIYERHFILLRFLVHSFNFIIPFCLSIGFADQSQRWIAFQSFRQLDEHAEILTDDGIYLLSVIDLYQDGQLVRAAVGTMMGNVRKPDSRRTA